MLDWNLPPIRISKNYLLRNTADVNRQVHASIADALVTIIAIA
jgi:hypothetical protein